MSCLDLFSRLAALRFALTAEWGAGSEGQGSTRHRCHCIIGRCHGGGATAQDAKRKGDGTGTGTTRWDLDHENIKHMQAYGKPRKFGPVWTGNFYRRNKRAERTIQIYKKNKRCPLVIWNGGNVALTVARSWGKTSGAWQMESCRQSRGPLRASAQHLVGA